MTPETWRKSTYSGTDHNCVEVALAPVEVGVRDSKAPAAGELQVSPAGWRSFLLSVAEG